MHLQQGLVYPLVAAQDAEESAVGRGRARQLLSRGLHPRPDDLLRVLPQAQPVLLQVREESQQLLGTALDAVLGRRRQGPSHDPHAGTQLAPRPGPPAPGGVVFHRAVNDERRQPAHLLGVQVVGPHERLHLAQPLLPLETQLPGGVLLGLEGQPVLVPSGQEMQLVSGAPEEVPPALQGGRVPGLQQARSRQVPEPDGAALGAGDPHGGMDVAQAALALLHVGLQQEHRLAVPLAPPSVLTDLGLDEPVAGASAELPPHHLLQVPVQARIAAHVAHVHQGRLDHVVAPGVARALRHRPGGVAHRQAGVPQGVEYLLGDELHVRGRAPAVEKEDVDVRMGIQLAPPVSALGHQGATALHPRARGAALVHGRLEQPPQEAIDHLPVSPHHVRARGPGPVGLQQPLPPQVDVAPHPVPRHGVP